MGRVGGGMGLGIKAALGALVALSMAAALVPAGANAATYDGLVQLTPGFRGVGISASGHEVSAYTLGGGEAVSGYYSGPGKVSRREITGRLGRFGSVRLRFHPEGKPQKTHRPNACGGSPRVLETWEGTYTGSVRYQPDAHLRGYTGEGSWKGSMSTALHWHCKGEEYRPEFDPHAGGVVVDAANCDGDQFQASVEVDPASPPPPPGDGSRATANFSASWTRKVGIVTVSYGVSAQGGPKTAVFADDLSEGTLKPPPPFHGEATIRRQGEAWEWAGDLTADFPDRTISLTGPDFKPFVTTYEPRPDTAYLFGFSLRC